jgi:MoaA/NifB/PqqE/SkfB family radical SAM enzyme
MWQTTRSLMNLAGDRLHALPLLVLYLTDGCNSRCVTCDIWRSPRRNMAPALVDQIVDACPDLGVRWVLLSGGEAMQHPDWPAIATRLRATGARVLLLTNGLLLRKQIDAVAANVDEVIISLDGGTAATYAAIRGVDAFDLVCEGIGAASARGIPVTTRTTIGRANYAELPQIIEAARAAGAARISFLAVDVLSAEAFGPRDLDNASGALTAEDIDAFEAVLDDVTARYADAFASGLLAESPGKLRRLVDYFRAVNGAGVYPAPRCNAPHISTVVEVDGRLRPCYFLPTYGRITPDDDLGTALNTDVARALRRAYRTGQRTECAHCVCPLYKGPRSLLTM